MAVIFFFLTTASGNYPGTVRTLVCLFYGGVRRECLSLSRASPGLLCQIL
jgi:hypothetical protein